MASDFTANELPSPTHCETSPVEAENAPGGGLVLASDGMTEQIRRRAIDPVFTTRSGRLGLALAHARKPLREAGGQWKIESRRHVGTQFAMLIP